MPGEIVEVILGVVELAGTLATRKSEKEAEAKTEEEPPQPTEPTQE